jgi:hypothetical protein
MPERLLEEGSVLAMLSDNFGATNAFLPSLRRVECVCVVGVRAMNLENSVWPGDLVFLGEQQNWQNLLTQQGFGVLSE